MKRTSGIKIYALAILASFALALPAFADEFDAFDEQKLLEIKPAILQKMGVRLTKVKYGDSTKSIKLPGIINTDETSTFTVNTKFGGWIEKLYLDYTGKTVGKGARIAEVYSPEMVAAQEEYLSFLRHANGLKGQQQDAYGGVFANDANQLAAGARARLKYWDLSEAQIRELERTGKPRRTVSVYSPANGYVLAKNVSAGMMVQPGMALFTLASTDRMWVIADVYEEDMKFIRQGATAKFTLANQPNVAFDIRADYIYPEMSPSSRTLKVRFPVNNRKNILKPAMYGDVILSVKSGKVLKVEEDAVMDDGRRKIVFVSKGAGKFEPREIVTGAKTDGFYEIRRGLKANDVVARGANFLLDSEAQLKGINPVKVQ